MCACGAARRGAARAAGGAGAVGPAETSRRHPADGDASRALVRLPDALVVPADEAERAAAVITAALTELPARRDGSDDERLQARDYPHTRAAPKNRTEQRGHGTGRARE
jgi:hypothetical protein